MQSNNIKFVNFSNFFFFYYKASKKPKKTVPEAAKPVKKGTKKKFQGKKLKKSKKEEKGDKIQERAPSSRRIDSTESRTPLLHSSVQSLKSGDARRSSGAKSSQLVSSTPATEDRKSVDIDFVFVKDEFR